MNALISAKTTVFGLITGAILILGEIQAIVDDDPETNPRIEVILAGLATAGLGVSARDANKSSQDHKIRP
jgi:hypothetical protein